MTWVRRLLAAAVALLIVGISAVAWVLQPGYERRPMRTWGEALRLQASGSEDREPLAAVFRNWDRDLPAGELRAAPKPHNFRRNPKSLEVEYEFDGATRSLTDYLARARVEGLLALHDGQVVLELYPAATTAESRYHLWSASKSFTGTLIGMALHDGTIEDFDDPVETYAPRFRGTAYGESKVRHVMMMSSGVDFFHHQGFPERNWMYLRIFRRGHDLDDFAAELGRRVPGGTDFNYLATDTHVLSRVLEGATGMPFLKVVQKRLWDRLGIAGDALWTQHAPGGEGVPFGHCCLAARLIDFAHLGEFYLQDGVWNDERLVPEGWAEMAGSPQAAFQEPTETRSGYAMQFWVPFGADGEFYGAGAFGQYVWIDRPRGVVIAQLAAQLPGDLDERERNAAFRALATAIHDAP